MPLERRPLDLLLPHVALLVGRADAAKVRPHPPSPAAFPAPSSSAAPAALAPHVLDPHRPRPPARQVIRIRDQIPDPPPRGGDQPPAGHLGHRAAAGETGRRSARPRAGVGRGPGADASGALHTAARLSRLSIASLRRAWLRERSAGPRAAGAAPPRGRRRCGTPAGCAPRPRTATARRRRGRSRGRSRRRAACRRGAPAGRSRTPGARASSSSETPASSSSSSSGQVGDRRVDRDRPAGRGGLARRRRAPVKSPRRQLLADHPQGQELVALHSQDRPQALDVGLAVEPVPTRGAARRSSFWSSR